jgi:hypothetical protein
MKDTDMVSVHFDGKINRGQRAKMIAWLEAMGFAAIRAEESPHSAWQAAEYLKRENNG